MRLDDAIDRLSSALAAHPECDLAAARDATQTGRPRPHATFCLRHVVDVGAGESQFRHEARCAAATEPDVERLAGQIDAIAAPLAQHNPVAPELELGVGPGTLAGCFGLPLLAEAGYHPAEHLSLDALLDGGCPDAATSGLMPQIRRHVELIRAHCPDWIKINLPDLQGPFNVAHMVLGNEAFLAPLDRPGDFHEAMRLISDLILGVQETISGWIVPPRLSPCPWKQYRIAECSVNMVSAAFYREHVLPHDQRIAQAWNGPLSVHTCHGPHVFHETLRGLPQIAQTEAGRIPGAVAGWTDVDEALAAIGDRPIVLEIGQELPEGREEETIRRDLDRLLENPRLLLTYTGMHWRCADEPTIRAMHHRLDDYYEGQVRTRRPGHA